MLPCLVGCMGWTPVLISKRLLECVPVQWNVQDSWPCFWNSLPESQFAHMILLVLLENVGALCRLWCVTNLVFNAGLSIRCLLVLFETSCLIVGRDRTCGQRMPNEGDSVVWLRFKTPESRIPTLHWQVLITVEARAVSLVCEKL
jgi:hypothetical protein